MMDRFARVVLLSVLGLVVPAAATPQERLSLADALTRARSAHVDARLAQLAEAEARASADEARSGRLPRVDVIESWQRGNQPVFVFGSLLSQRRFSADRFDPATLNQPDPVTDFRAAVLAEHTAFDATVGPAVRSAELGVGAAALKREQATQAITTEVISAYGRIWLLEAFAVAARGALETAAGDLERARNRCDAGLATEADVLSAEVHRAAMREREITTLSEARIARASLNRLIGAPLDAQFALEPLPAAKPVLAGDAAESHALTVRPDVQIAAVRLEQAGVAIQAARGAFLPQVVVRGGVEWHGGDFDARERAWMLGAELRLALFRGGSNRARLARAQVVRDQRQVEVEDAQLQARLEIRSTSARTEAAEARQAAASAAVAQARESHRILRDRYQAGLADITSVLRAAEAVLDADARALAADVDRVVEHARLEAALGR
jgi:outer membrane protein TolC